MQPPKRTAQIRPARQEELLLWFAKQPRATRVRIHKEKLQVFRAWLGEQQTDAKKESYPKEELDYLALISAIAETKRQIDEPKSQKAFVLRTQQITEQRKHRKAPIQDKIEKDFLPLIHQLRVQKLSWREIQEYIRVHHYKKFGVSTLHKVYKAEYGGGNVADEEGTETK